MADLLIKKIQIGSQAYSIYDERVQKAVPANAVFTDTTYGAEGGITLASGNKFKHTNSVDAVSSQKLLKITYDAYGHITGSSAVTKEDIAGLGVSITDNNTTYKLTIGTTTNGDTEHGVDLGTLVSKDAVSGGTDLSLVTTGEKAAWNAKTSNTGTVTSVTGTDGITGSGTTTATLKANLKSYAKNSNAIGGKLYGVELDKDGKLAVNVPWTDTKYSGTQGITLSGTTFKHTNSITAQQTDAVFKKIKYDAQGHITGVKDVEPGDITPLIADATGEITKLQTLVNNIKAELEDPSATGLTSVLETMQNILNSSANAVTGIKYTKQVLSVTDGVLSISDGGVTPTTAAFVTANGRVEPITLKA